MELVTQKARTLLRQARNDGLTIEALETDGGGEFMAAFDRMLSAQHVRQDSPTGTSPADKASMRSMAGQSQVPSGAGDHNYNALIVERANQTIRYLLARFSSKDEQDLQRTSDMGQVPSKGARNV